MRSVDYRIPDISKLHIRQLTRDLLKKEIIKSKDHAFVECYWKEDLDHDKILPRNKNSL